MNKKTCLNSYPEILKILDGVPVDVILNKTEITKFKKGHKIYTKGEPITQAHIVFSGIVKIVNEFENGVNFVHKKLMPITMLGDIEIISQILKPASSVITATECYALTIDIATFHKWFVDYPKFSNTVAKNLAIRFYDISDSVGSNMVSNAKHNFAKLLISFYENSNDENIVVAETRKQLSEMLLVTERTVNRSILYLKDNDYITVKAHKIHLSHDQYLRLKSSLNDNL